MFKEKQCCKQCKHAKFIDTMTQWTYKNKLRTAQNAQNNNTIRINCFRVFWIFQLFLFILDF